MITGFDTVIVTAAPVDSGIRTMLDELRRRWPSLRVALAGGGAFTPWAIARHAMAANAGEILVARDARMEHRWDEEGYCLMEDGEGPFALLYQPAARPVVEVRFNDDPYGRESRFEPYSATVVMAGLSLVTVVTPDEDSPFSRNIRSLLQRALISQMRRN
jgi:hypothetical protein